jgi:hypothetical protein
MLPGVTVVVIPILPEFIGTLVLIMVCGELAGAEGRDEQAAKTRIMTISKMGSFLSMGFSDMF